MGGKCKPADCALAWGELPHLCGGGYKKGYPEFKALLTTRKKNSNAVCAREKHQKGQRTVK